MKCNNTSIKINDQLRPILDTRRNASATRFVDTPKLVPVKGAYGIAFTAAAVPSNPRIYKREVDLRAYKVIIKWSHLKFVLSVANQ